MDARELKVADDIDFVCPSQSCSHGTHRVTVVKREGAYLTLVFHSAPFMGIRAELIKSELWLVNGPKIEVADIHKGEGAEIVKGFKDFEILIEESLEHQFSEPDFDLMLESHRSELSEVEALYKDRRITTSSAYAFGALMIAGVEPTAKAVAVFVRCIKLAEKNGASNGFLNLLGSALFDLDD